MADTDLLDYAGLKHYDSKIKSCMWNWQKTKKNVLVQFKPVPESDLEPVVDFMFTETPPAEGEKGPSNPSTITGVSQTKVTRCGKNLCPIDKISLDWSVTGLTVSANTNDGYISISGTATTSASVASIYLRYVSGKNSVFAANGILRGETYTFSLSGDAPSSVSLNLFVKSTATTGWAKRVNVTSGHSQTYTIPETAYDAILRLDVASGSVVDCNCYVQVEKGSTATAFEPYAGNDYTIQLGGTYYGGTLDVATGVMTVTHAAIIPSRSYIETSSITATTSANIWQVYLGALNPQANVFDYSAAAGYGGIDYRCNYFSFDRTGNTVSFHVSEGNSFASFEGSSAENARQNFLSFYDSAVANNNPLIIVYPVKTPFTVQLTPTQIRSLPAIDKYEPRTNTVYSDQEAVQVGYQRFYDENRLAAIEARLDTLEGN